MPLIEWTAALETGHPAIDKDHHALVELLNRFDAESGADRIIATARLDQLVIHASEHFSREEQLMATAGYEQMARHQKEHRYLGEELNHRVQAVRAGTADPKQASLFLRDWLLHHVACSDRQLAESLARSTTKTSG